jgi:hypothetical protein
MEAVRIRYNANLIPAMTDKRQKHRHRAGFGGQRLMRIALSLKPVAEIAKRGTLHERLRAGQSNPRVEAFDQREIP